MDDAVLGLLESDKKQKKGILIRQVFVILRYNYPHVISWVQAKKTEFSLISKEQNNHFTVTSTCRKRIKKL